MEDDQQKHEILTNGSNNNNNVGSPESPNLKTSNSNNIINNKEQDRFLPIANVGRIMKKVIPGNGKISKDAKETVQECVSEFISFVTGEASDKCQREKRKTINGDDIIWAITTLGFEDYVAPLKTYLSRYRDHEGDKLNNTPKQQQRSSSSTTTATTTNAAATTTTSSSSDQQHRLQHFQEMSQELNQEHNNNNNNNMVAGMGGPYSSATSIYSTISTTPNSFAAMDHHHHHHQPFPLPFSPNPIQKQLHQQDHLDSFYN